MSRPSSRISFHKDPVSRIAMRSLFLLQLAAMVIVLVLCLSGYFVPALMISLFTLLILFSVLVWLYLRYQTLPVVCEKKNLSRLVIKFGRNLQIEELREQAALRERGRLVRAETQEIQTALRALQKNYIETGLGKATIKHAAITGIGPKLKERLAGYGIITALHVNDRVAELPGFDAEKCQALLSWRSSIVAKLEATKPSALPPEQLELIQQKYHTLQEQNNALEKKAIASEQILEYELLSLKPHLHSLEYVTFRGYLSRSLASHGVVAALVSIVMVMTQMVSSVSAAIAFGNSNTMALMASIPVTGATPTVSFTSTALPAPTFTFIATGIPSETRTATLTATQTNTATVTFTPLPTITLQPQNTPTIAAPPVSSGGDSGNCDPSYPTVCIPPPPPDLDCGDIPYDNFTVLPPDPHNFDREGDGLGCEG